MARSRYDELPVEGTAGRPLNDLDPAAVFHEAILNAATSKHRGWRRNSHQLIRIVKRAAKRRVVETIGHSSATRNTLAIRIDVPLSSSGNSSVLRDDEAKGQNHRRAQVSPSGKPAPCGRITDASLGGFPKINGQATNTERGSRIPCALAVGLSRTVVCLARGHAAGDPFGMGASRCKNIFLTSWPQPL